MGRFITQDPIRDGINWYAYDGNNPLVYVDPTGLRPRAKRDYEEPVSDENNAKPVTPIGVPGPMATFKEVDTGNDIANIGLGVAAGIANIPSSVINLVLGHASNVNDAASSVGKSVDNVVTPLIGISLQDAFFAIEAGGGPGFTTALIQKIQTGFKSMKPCFSSGNAAGNVKKLFGPSRAASYIKVWEVGVVNPTLQRGAFKVTPGQSYMWAIDEAGVPVIGQEVLAPGASA